jgi:hypothetical protein
MQFFRILWRAPLPFNIRVKPEEQLCIGIADMLRQASLQNRLKAIWSHVPNEGKRHVLVALVMKAMGMLPGTPDYFFIWADGGGVIEIKVGKGRMSDNQKDYKTWCYVLGVKHAVCRSLGEVTDTLTGWGILI